MSDRGMTLLRRWQRISWVFAAFLWSPEAQADAGVYRCQPGEPRCVEPTYQVVPVSSRQARPWNARATAAVLAAAAHDTVQPPGISGLVVFDVSVALPRRYRRVPDEEAGKKVLMKCGKERLLLLVHLMNTRIDGPKSAAVELSTTTIEAVCDRAERSVQYQAVETYRVIFKGGRPQVLLLSAVVS